MECSKCDKKNAPFIIERIERFWIFKARTPVAYLCENCVSEVVPEQMRALEHEREWDRAIK